MTITTPQAIARIARQAREISRVLRGEITTPTKKRRPRGSGSVDQVTKKHRRPRGNGSVYKIGRVYWIAYRNAAGDRVKESSGSMKKSVAETLLNSRNGARIHHVPVIKNAEKVTFNE